MRKSLWMLVSWHGDQRFFRHRRTGLYRIVSPRDTWNIPPILHAWSLWECMQNERIYHGKA